MCNACHVSPCKCRILSKQNINQNKTNLINASGISNARMSSSKSFSNTSSNSHEGEVVPDQSGMIFNTQASSSKSVSKSKSKINFYDKAIDCYVYGEGNLVTQEWFDAFIQTCDDRIIDVFSGGFDISFSSCNVAVFSHRYAGGFGILKIANVFTYEFISAIISDWTSGGVKAKLSLERIEINRPVRGSFWVKSPAKHSVEKLSSALVYHNRVASFKIIKSYQQTSRHGEDGVVHVFEVSGEDKVNIINANGLLFLGMSRFLVRWGGLNRLSKAPFYQNQNSNIEINNANASLSGQRNQDIISTNTDTNVGGSNNSVQCITPGIADGGSVFINNIIKPPDENYV